MVMLDHTTTVRGNKHMMQSKEHILMLQFRPIYNCTYGNPYSIQVPYNLDSTSDYVSEEVNTYYKQKARVYIVVLFYGYYDMKGG